MRSRHSSQRFRGAASFCRLVVHREPYLRRDGDVIAAPMPMAHSGSSIGSSSARRCSGRRGLEFGSDGIRDGLQRFRDIALRSPAVHGAWCRRPGEVRGIPPPERRGAHPSSAEWTGFAGPEGWESPGRSISCPFVAGAGDRPARPSARRRGRPRRWRHPPPSSPAHTPDRRHAGRLELTGTAASSRPRSRHARTPRSARSRLAGSRSRRWG